MNGNAVLARANERFASRRPLQRQLDRIAQLGGHVDQRIQGEFLGAAFYQVIHAGLGDVGALGGIGLGDAELGDDFADVHNQVGSQQQVMSSPDRSRRQQLPKRQFRQ